jgi:hypothetical protein
MGMGKGMRKGMGMKKGKGKRRGESAPFCWLFCFRALSDF